MPTHASLADDRRSLRRDLRSGEAGFVPRAGLSIGAAGVTLALVLLGLAVLDAGGFPVRDETIGIGLALGALAWIGELFLLWFTYRRMRAGLRIAFIVLGIWVVAITASLIVAAATWNEELFIGAIIVGAIGASICVVCAGAYRASQGREIIGSSGTVNVLCPECGYSMVGKSDCRCPECGSAYTIDELITRQDFEAYRRSPRSQPPPVATSSREPASPPSLPATHGVQPVPADGA